ncbi:MAG TPA: SDR family NAD(P)-dependent oxidoreductase [Acidimicrobiia bacterium]
MNRLAVAGFTNLGYLIHARGFEADHADMSGKTVLVTGATGGLGKETARVLTGRGARVIVVGRSSEKLARARDELGGGVVTLQADLSSMEEIRRLAADVIGSEPRLDVLVNNVGVLLPQRALSDEGMELTLATNLAGSFLLTNLLVPLLLRSAPARIVNVSSGGMYAERIRPDDLQYERGAYRGASAYARTKRGQVVLTEMWAERLAGSGVVVHAMHPGWVGTAGVEQSLPTFNRLMRPLLRTVAQGADTIVWLATAPEPASSTGRFWFDREVAPTHLSRSTRERPGEREALWEALTRLTGWEADRSAG